MCFGDDYYIGVWDIFWLDLVYFWDVVVVFCIVVKLGVELSDSWEEFVWLCGYFMVVWFRECGLLFYFGGSDGYFGVVFGVWFSFRERVSYISIFGRFLFLVMFNMLFFGIVRVFSIWYCFVSFWLEVFFFVELCGLY